MSARHQIGTLVIAALAASGCTREPTDPVILAIHGGAGTISRGELSADLERQYREALSAALRAGAKILNSGGTSIAAVEATIMVMEDSPLFNAGKGAVFTTDGRNALDASIMDGRTNAAGAVAGVATIKNPIRAARAVMERTPHVMLAGRGAERFASEAGLELVEPGYFKTEHRWQQLLEARENGDFKLGEAGRQGTVGKRGPGRKLGTVGAVARDQHGNLAAGTSTGGLTNKRFDRIGDSPVIGAGTYANNDTCAVSCTGHGEFFIRNVVAHDVAARMAYGGASVQEAAVSVVKRKLVKLGGSGGLIALDRHGNVAMPFNTAGMYRGTVSQRGKVLVQIYDGE